MRLTPAGSVVIVRAGKGVKVFRVASEWRHGGGGLLLGASLGEAMLALGFAVKLIPPAQVKPTSDATRTTRPMQRQSARQRSSGGASASFPCTRSRTRPS